MINVGNHRLHFTIWKGTGIPILFESGSGNDATIWHPFMEPIQKITGTTLITYDRTGYGKSELNPTLPDNKKSLITHSIADLQNALQQLGYDQEIMLVSHSFGALFNINFANQNPEKVKSMVFIDGAISCFKTPEYLEKKRAERTEAWLAHIKSLSEGLYYECLAYEEIVDIMSTMEAPTTIPIISLYSEKSPPNEPNEQERWATCQKELVQAAPNRIGIQGLECGHYVHYDNPMLAVQSIAKAYCLARPNADNQAILQRSLDYGIARSNTNRQEEFAYWHSERDLNNWGYDFLKKEELNKALVVLQLNTLLFPESFNVWDSYGEILLKMGKKEEAIKMYQKSLKLNPDNENGQKVLETLLKK